MEGRAQTMPPAVRIEAKAWDDPAFAVLAMRLGWQDADLAIVKCARVWAHATEQNDPAIPVVEVDAIVRVPGFALHMVAARLADVSEKNSDEIVLRGATGKNRNRISWLATKRKNSRKGGDAQRAKWGAKGDPIGVRSGEPKGTPNTPAPAPAPAIAGSERDLVASGDQPALLVIPERPPPFDLLAIYKRHPRHEGKGKGLAKLKAQIRTAADYEALCRAQAAYLASKPVADGFVRHFDTWVNSWRDHLEQPHVTAVASRTYNGRG